LTNLTDFGEKTEAGRFFCAALKIYFMDELPPFFIKISGPDFPIKIRSEERRALDILKSYVFATPMCDFVYVRGSGAGRVGLGCHTSGLCHRSINLIDLKVVESKMINLDKSR